MQQGKEKMLTDGIGIIDFAQILFTHLPEEKEKSSRDKDGREKIQQAKEELKQLRMEQSKARDKNLGLGL